MATARTRLLSSGLALLLALAALPLLATPALACDGHLVLNPDGSFRCVASGGGGGGGGGGGNTWTPPPGYVLIEWGSQGMEDGEPCIQANAEWVPAEVATSLMGARVLALHGWLEAQATNGYWNVQACSTPAGDPMPTREMIQEIIRGLLPTPDPNLQPSDRTLPGLRTYLQIGAPTTFDESIDGASLPVTLVVNGTAEYRVDWGDGTVETYASSGGPYPDGDVTHVYTDAGEATVTVTPVWTVSWSIGGSAPDTLPPMELLDAQLQIPITEIRSVRIR